MLLHGTLCTTCLLLCILMILQCENLWDVSCMYKSVSGSVSPPLESEGDVFPSGYGSRDSIIRAGPKRDWKRLRPGQIKRTDSCSSWEQGHIRVEVGPEKQQAAFGLSGGAAMRCSTLLAIFTGVILYLVLGAVVFRALETPLEKHEHTKLLETLQNTSLDFQLNNACVDFDKLQEFLQKVANDLGADIDVIGNTTFATKWDIASALFFSGTIITTIGYGHISPQTDGGKLFCIFYALVGIPMFGILLAGVGDHLGTALRKTVAKIENLFLKWRVSPTIVRVISAVLSILLGCLLFVAVPILIFQRVEDWTLLESAYFVVITLTTVGFGDYVAGDRSQVDPSGDNGEDHKDKLDYLWRVHMYQPLVWFWILLGLAYFASILTMIGNWLRVLSKKTRAEMEELRAHATDWTQNIQNMSVDFRIPGKIDDPFRRRRRKHRHGHRSKGHSVSANGAPKGDGAEDQQESESESGSYSSYSSDESESESETDSQATQTDRVPEEKNGGPKTEEAPPLTHLSQPLDYFGENLAFIDESSDAQSGKLHLDPLVDPKQPSCRPGKRRRHRRPVHRRGSKMSGSNKQQPNGSAKPVSDLPPKPQE